MLKPGLRLFFPGLLLCLVTGYRIITPHEKGTAADLTALPVELMGLPGIDVPVEQAILDDLNPDGLVIRRYMRPDGIPVWVVLIYFVNRRLGGHDPQLCYRSQGYRTESLPGITLSSPSGILEAESFLASRPGRVERVATFWYTSGLGAVSDVGRYRRRLFIQGLRGNRLYGIFVRISTLETDKDGEAAMWNQRFVAEVAQKLPSLVAR